MPTDVMSFYLEIKPGMDDYAYCGDRLYHRQGDGFINGREYYIDTMDHTRFLFWCGRNNRHQFYISGMDYFPGLNNWGYCSQWQMSNSCPTGSL